MESLKKGENQGKSHNLKLNNCWWTSWKLTPNQKDWICTPHGKIWHLTGQDQLWWSCSDSVMKREKNLKVPRSSSANILQTMWDRNKWSCSVNLRKHVSRDRLHIYDDQLIVHQLCSTWMIWFGNMFIFSHSNCLILYYYKSNNIPNRSAVFLYRANINTTKKNILNTYAKEVCFSSMSGAHPRMMIIWPTIFLPGSYTTCFIIALKVHYATFLQTTTQSSW